MRRPVTRLAVALVVMVAFAAVIAQSATTTVFVTKTGAKITPLLRAIPDPRSRSSPIPDPRSCAV